MSQVKASTFTASLRNVLFGCLALQSGAPIRPCMAQRSFKAGCLASVVAEDAGSDCAAEGLAEFAAKGAVLRESDSFFYVGVFVFRSPLGVANGGEERESHTRSMAVADE